MNWGLIHMIEMIGCVLIVELFKTNKFIQIIEIVRFLLNFLYPWLHIKLGIPKLSKILPSVKLYRKRVDKWHWVSNQGNTGKQKYVPRTSWRRSLKTPYGCPYMVLYVTSRDFPWWRMRISPTGGSMSRSETLWHYWDVALEALSTKRLQYMHICNSPDINKIKFWTQVQTDHLTITCLLKVYLIGEKNSGKSD